MSLGKEQAAFLLDIGKLDVYATSLGFKVTPGEMLRTKEQQALHVAAGRSKTMNSMHLKGLAADRNFFKVLPPMTTETYINGYVPNLAYEILRPLGEYWESLNPKNRWGGNFDKDWDRKDPWVDLPHFERQV
jgi:hypothetical protein